MLKRITGSIIALSLVFGMTVLSFAEKVETSSAGSGTVAPCTFGENG